jgi:predicted HicB family RNase H-like nuclease
MARKTANNAIDFGKIFALKERLAEKEPPGTNDDAELAPTAVAAYRETPSTPAPPSVETPRTALEPPPASVLQLLPPASVEPQPNADESRGVDELAAPPAAEKGRGDASGVLRIGMPRKLHDTLRALAALRGRSVTTYVREALEQTPEIDPRAPFSELQALARTVAPVVTAHAHIEVRMQVPVSEHVHARLHQIAALRGQTLGACLADVLEARASR